VTFLDAGQQWLRPDAVNLAQLRFCFVQNEALEAA
jgi:hypothetical protein